MSAPIVSLSVGVDDTGNDALTTILTSSLALNRVTLTAAILFRENVAAFVADWRALIANLNRTFVLNEIHASHIVNGSIATRTRIGRKEAKQLQWEGWCDALGLLRKHQIVFVVQTVHVDTLAELKHELGSLETDDARAVFNQLKPTSGGLKRAAWLLLSRSVASEVRRMSGGSSSTQLDVEWHVDHSTDFERLEPELERASSHGYFMWNARFLPSVNSCLIQAADCAGYVLILIRFQ